MLASCTALDPYLNPYYDDEDVAGESQSNSSKGRSIDSIVRTRDEVSEDNNEFSSLTPANAEELAQEQHAQDESILLTAGPNPYLASAPLDNAAANAQFSRALAAMDNENWASAEQILIELTKQYPKLSSPWQNLGCGTSKAR